MPSTVFFIPASREESDESIAEKTVKVFQHIGLDKQIEREHFVGLKMHFGEKGNTGFIKPPWLVQLIKKIKKKTSRVYITDTNALYVGNRSNATAHLKLAADHGFTIETLGIPVIIADGLIGRDDDEVEVDFPRVKTAKVASAFLNTDFLVCLSHFTGHIQAGFGAALKNLGMGCASRSGKLEQHSDVQPWINQKACLKCLTCIDYCPANAIEEGEESVRIAPEKCIGCGECLVVCSVGAVKMRWDDDSIRVQEKMAEYACSLSKVLNGNIACLNFVVGVTKNCDCMAKDEPAIVDDIGILGSLDPVAVDSASVNLVNERSRRDLLKDVHNADWTVQLKHAQQIGLGRMDYDLIEIE
ncbi:MAG: DUF362 domain-containing protein [Candidatus Aminicenantes bacterium]|jgi:uncharacterized Fe-S center protein